MSGLPAGLATGPLAAADIAEITAVWRACEQHDDGRAEVVEDDLVASFARPSFDLPRDTVGVRDGGALVAFGLQFGERHTFVGVLPSHRGRGVGTWLVDWTQAAGRAAGHEETGQSVTEHEAAARELLERHGFARRWDGWMLELVLDRDPGPPPLPPGYAIRDFASGRDDRAVHALVERAFSEWPEREPAAFADWAAMALGRPGFDPTRLALAVRGDEIVGAMLLIDDPDGEECWVEQLAVAREHRGQGLGRALLVHAFGVTWRSGTRRCGLATDSRTGALGLYRHVGMRVRKAYGEYVKRL